jgi:hypothetical protein
MYTVYLNAIFKNINLKSIISPRFIQNIYKKNISLSITPLCITLHIYIKYNINFSVKSVTLYNFRSRDEYYAQYSVSRILLYPTIMKLECTCAN